METSIRTDIGDFDVSFPRDVLLPETTDVISQ
jgi:hypothetical protein